MSMFSHKINVYIISPGLPIPPSKGGAVETIIYETVNFYKDFNAFIFSESDKIENVALFNNEHAHFFQLKTRRFILNLQDLLSRLAVKGIFFLYDFFFIRRVTSKITFQPNIIHIHNNFYYILYLKRRFPKTHIILHMHNEFLFYYRYLYSQYTRVLDLADKIIVCSEYIGKSIGNRYKKCQDKISVIKNGVSLSRFKKLANDDAALDNWRKKLRLDVNTKVVIFVGRICEDKGVEVLLNAFRQLCNEYGNLRLLVVGSSFFAEEKKTPYLKEIYRISNSLKDKIIFTGFVAHDKLNILYNLAHICVVPSIFNEPFGLVNLEAMASGCAVIASHIGGMPEVIKNQETGLLFVPNDVNALREKIKYLIDNENIRQYLIKNAIEYVNDYDWSIVASRYEAIYKEVLDNISS